jgi:uncharacterized protein with HEPN domain
MPRRDELYLADVVEACRDVVRFVADLSLDDWLTNDLVRYAVLQRLTVIGEAARRLSPEVRCRHGQVPWRLIGDFRNLAVHNYFSVEWPLVWTMARSDVPRLLGQVTAILAEHYPGVLSVLDEPSDGA